MPPSNELQCVLFRPTAPATSRDVSCCVERPAARNILTELHGHRIIQQPCSARSVRQRCRHIIVPARVSISSCIKLEYILGQLVIYLQNRAAISRNNHTGLILAAGVFRTIIFPTGSGFIRNIAVGCFNRRADLACCGIRVIKDIRTHCSCGIVGLKHVDDGILNFLAFPASIERGVTQDFDRSGHLGTGAVTGLIRLGEPAGEVIALAGRRVIICRECYLFAIGIGTTRDIAAAVGLKGE